MSDDKGKQNMHDSRREYLVNSREGGKKSDIQHEESSDVTVTQIQLSVGYE
jgi:hypothetical protein